MVAVTGTAVECKLEESIDGEKKVAAKASPNLMCSSSTGQTVSGAIGVGVATGLLKPDKKSAIPEISYSSSDDDDFYDAEDQGRRGGDRLFDSLITQRVHIIFAHDINAVCYLNTFREGTGSRHRRTKRINPCPRPRHPTRRRT